MFCFQEVVAQRKDNEATKKPVLTNKYRLKKRGKPAEGVQSRGSEKIPKQRTVISGYNAGEKRYTQAPKVMGQSQFRGTDPLYPREKQTGFATLNQKINILCESRKQALLASYQKPNINLINFVEVTINLFPIPSFNRIKNVQVTTSLFLITNLSHTNFAEATINLQGGLSNTAFWKNAKRRLPTILANNKTTWEI